MIKKERVREIINQLLHEIEEEDIGISLFSTWYQVAEELSFFKEEDRERVVKILTRLADDSKRHKKHLDKIISELGKHSHEK